MPRACIHCEHLFEPIPSFEERLQARGSYQKVCPSCAIAAINDMAAESVWEMTDAEIEAELRADGVDVEALAERTRKLLLEAMAKRDGGDNAA